MKQGTVKPPKDESKGQKHMGIETLGGSELQSPAGETFIVEIQPVLHIDPPTSFFSFFEPPKSLPFTESVEI